MGKLIIAVLILIFACPNVSFAKLVKEYYPNGKIKYLANYNSQNQLNGWYKFYWPNGQLKEQGRYKNDRHVGTIKRYSTDGVLLGQ